ncbi:hypothetical protein BDD30_4488 [Photorhabdus asymbiotica]|uniref:Uncharacterized protein n=1 Tax=Photorhabdus asymbiotica TaxID=291112 RepID=A0ABX9SG39_9GAMM|nr:hypothetical protein BDD30_4488 [Photorhabdus asymbiotica]
MSALIKVFLTTKLLIFLFDVMDRILVMKSGVIMR